MGREDGQSPVLEDHRAFTCPGPLRVSHQFLGVITPFYRSANSRKQKREEAGSLKKVRREEAGLGSAPRA